MHRQQSYGWAPNANLGPKLVEIGTPWPRTCQSPVIWVRSPHVIQLPADQRHRRTCRTVTWAHVKGWTRPHTELRAKHSSVHLKSLSGGAICHTWYTCVSEVRRWTLLWKVRQSLPRWGECPQGSLSPLAFPCVLSCYLGVQLLPSISKSGVTLYITDDAFSWNDCLPESLGCGPQDVEFLLFLSLVAEVWVVMQPIHPSLARATILPH